MLYDKNFLHGLVQALETNVMLLGSIKGHRQDLDNLIHIVSHVADWAEEIPRLFCLGYVSSDEQQGLQLSTIEDSFSQKLSRDLADAYLDSSSIKTVRYLVSQLGKRNELPRYKQRLVAKKFIDFVDKCWIRSSKLEKFISTFCDVDPIGYVKRAAWEKNLSVNRIKDMSDLQKDLLKATVYVLRKYDLDVTNSCNVVRVLSGIYHVEDLEQEILDIYYNLDGLQDPDVSRLFSPDAIRRNEQGSSPYYVRMPGMSYTSAVRQTLEDEEFEISELQYDTPKCLPPREDLKKRKITDDDPDIDNDPDTTNNPDFRKAFKDLPVREYLRFVPSEAGDKAIEITYHDKYNEDAKGKAKAAGVVYCQLPLSSSLEERFSLVAPTVKAYLEGSGLRGQIELDWWKVPHKIAALSQGFNQIHADEDEIAVNYAIL